MIKKEMNDRREELVHFNCDSCHVEIGWCFGPFFFNDGQQWVYAPLLCEKCGTDLSKNVGDLTKQKEELELKNKWAMEQIGKVIQYIEGKITELKVDKEEIAKRIAGLK